MELFDKKFVHFMWNDTLKNKYAFLEDSIVELERMVNIACDSDIHKILGQSDRSKYPFLASNGNVYIFAYYDPLYDYKVAYSSGASIEYRSKSSNTKWALVGTPIWDDERYEYRIKPKETPATNREVAEWLSKGNGHIRLECTVSTDYEYSTSMDNAVSSYKVRKWGDEEWHDATREYLGI